MRSEGNTGAYVAGRDVTVPTAPVIYVKSGELDDRHFHDLDLLGKCRTEKCDYGHAEPAISADLECLACGSIHPGKECVVPIPEPRQADEVVELPDYVMAIALVMRDTEGHPDRAVRAARKVVVTALQGLDRVLKASTSPSRVDAAPPDHVVETEVDARRRPGGLAANERMAGRDIKTIRAWAKSNGVECPTRGRFLPASVLEAYDRAHS